MAISDELFAFVKESLAKGLPPAQIEDALRRAGWPEEQIRGGLAGFAEIDFPVPVPRPRPNLSARDAFLYLVLFATLYTSAYHLAQLFFQIIEARLLPDESGSLGAEGQGARARRDA